MKYTEFGQEVYALGSDKDSARAVGVNTDRITIAVYADKRSLLAGLAWIRMSTG